MSKRRFCLEVAGPRACFTRPEMKGEAVSYDVITPAAARGIFTSILWKPAIEWVVTRIEVVNPIIMRTIRRNELSRFINQPTRGQLEGPPDSSVRLNIEDHRQQRAWLYLRDVRYRIHADLRYDPSREDTENHKKFPAMFERRVRKGQCFKQPYLGVREFACSFRLIENGSMQNEPPPLREDRDLGWMFYDYDYSVPERLVPMFFRAQMRSGVIDIPLMESGEIKR